MLINIIEVNDIISFKNMAFLKFITIILQSTFYVKLAIKNCTFFQQLYGCLSSKSPKGERYLQCLPVLGQRPPVLLDPSFLQEVSSSSALPYEKAVLYMVKAGLLLRDLEQLPFGVALPILQALYHCRQNPSYAWPEAAFALIGEKSIYMAEAFFKE